MIDSRMKLYVERARDLYHRAYMRFLPSSEEERLRAENRRKAFATIEQERRWGDSHASGWGSTVDYTKVTQEIVATVIRQFNVKSMVDAACGDFAWMPLVLQDLPDDFIYTGCDIVPNLISRHTAKYPRFTFRVHDFVRDEIPRCDLIFCRDVLQHLPVADIKQALQNFSRSGSTYLLTSTHLRRFGWKNGRECRVGQCRDRNLLLAPFSLPDPMMVFSERDESHKFLGLWKLPFVGTNGEPSSMTHNGGSDP